MKQAVPTDSEIAEYEIADQPRQPRRPKGWSWTAVSGFVLSLIGFLGVTAILGFVFGIFGLLATQNDRLRGRKLAIAAIPVSLVTGALFIVLLILLQVATTITGATDSLREAMGQSGDSAQGGIVSMRSVCTQEFNDTVSDEELQAWLTEVRAKHGTLASVELSPNQTSGPSRSGAVIICVGKFVNGAATIRLAPKFEKPWRCRIDDIEVDGSSPR